MLSVDKTLCGIWRLFLSFNELAVCRNCIPRLGCVICAILYLNRKFLNVISLKWHCYLHGVVPFLFDSVCKQFAVKSALNFQFNFSLATIRDKAFYSGTPPYSLLVNTVTSLLRPLFFVSAKRHTFSYKKSR